MLTKIVGSIHEAAVIDLTLKATLYLRLDQHLGCSYDLHAAIVAEWSQ